MSTEPLTIIYDGECPFCSSYVAMMRLREAVGPVALVDARSQAPAVRAAVAAGFDLEEGMLVHWQGTAYHGAQAVHLLALLSRGDGMFNRLQKLVFRSPRSAALLYPWMVRGRRLWLRLAGRAGLGGKKS